MSQTVQTSEANRIAGEWTRDCDRNEVEVDHLGRVEIAVRSSQSRLHLGRGRGPTCRLEQEGSCLDESIEEEMGSVVRLPAVVRSEVEDAMRLLLDLYHRVWGGPLIKGICEWWNENAERVARME